MAATLLLAASACGVETEEHTTVQDIASARWIQPHLDTLHRQGITGLLAEFHVRHHRSVARAGVARLDEPAPVPWNARFRMGSNTKTFVAVVVLQLVGEGKLSLDDSVERWLPGVVSGNGYDPAHITVRQLLQHTSGIYNYTRDIFEGFSLEYFLAMRFEHVDAASLVAMAMRHAPDFPPGTSWDYSNTNYTLAGMIIERVTGNDWATEVRTRILRPLRLRDTSEPGDRAELPAPHAQAYEPFTATGPLTDVTLMNHSWGGAAGSLITTTADLTRFWRELRRGTLLRPAEMAEMHRTVEATTLQGPLPGARYGLGIMQLPTSCGEPYWTHFGDTLGFATRNAVSDDGARVMVLSLSSQPRAESAVSVTTDTLELLDDAMCVAR
jgi:D-alanyl-D-alanine carboxypeptidase